MGSFVMQFERVEWSDQSRGSSGGSFNATMGEI